MKNVHYPFSYESHSSQSLKVNWGTTPSLHDYTLIQDLEKKNVLLNIFIKRLSIYCFHLNKMIMIIHRLKPEFSFICSVQWLRVTKLSLESLISNNIYIYMYINFFFKFYRYYAVLTIRFFLHKIYTIRIKIYYILYTAFGDH